MSDSYDVVVIGSGPGGYVAAIRASQLGLKTVCIEKAELGGVCLNWGCIPSKALLHNAHLYHELSHGKDLGFEIEGPIKVNWDKVIKRSRGVAGRLNKGVGSLFKKYKVDHLAGTAKIERPGVVAVDTDEGARTLEAKHIIVATGARARALPGVDFDGDRVMTYREAMTTKKRPDKLLIIGAGAIGCEFAYFYNAFGTEVTLVEMADHIVPVEDPEISQTLERAFKKQGIAVHTATQAADLVVTKKGVEAVLKPRSGEGEGEKIKADQVLVAIGIVPNIEGLGLEEAGVHVERWGIKVDANLQTTTPGIYAIGDVTGAPALAHKASAEAIHCVERIAGHHGKPVNYDNIPACTYCEPQIASVGLTEPQAKEKGHEVRVGKFPYMASGKALAVDAKDGFVKVVFDKKTGEILGCHMIGSGCTELIAEITLARAMEATEESILGTIHPHPSLSEMVHEAVGNAFGEGVNF